MGRIPLFSSAVGATCIPPGNATSDQRNWPQSYSSTQIFDLSGLICAHLWLFSSRTRRRWPVYSRTHELQIQFFPIFLQKSCLKTSGRFSLSHRLCKPVFIYMKCHMNMSDAEAGIWPAQIGRVQSGIWFLFCVLWRRLCVKSSHSAKFNLAPDGYPIVHPCRASAGNSALRHWEAGARCFKDHHQIPANLTCFFEKADQKCGIKIAQAGMFLSLNCPLSRFKNCVKMAHTVELS